MIREWDVHVMLTQMAKMGLFVRIIQHTPNSGDPLLTDDVLALMDRVESYATTSDVAADKMARVIAGRVVDSHRIHHQDARRRQVHDGFETVDFTTKTVGKESSTTTKGKRDRARFREELEQVDHYMATSDWFREYAQGLMGAPVGRRLVGEGDQVFWEDVHRRDEPWGFPELTSRALETFYQEMLKRPEFVTPTFSAGATTLPSPSTDSTWQPSSNSSNGRNGHSTQPSLSEATRALQAILRRTGRNRDVR